MGWAGRSHQPLTSRQQKLVLGSCCLVCAVAAGSEYLPTFLCPGRRNYPAVFEAAMHPHVMAALRTSNESILLIGGGGPDLHVPPALKELVRVEINLPFKEYYDLLEQCRCILTAFGSGNYITRQFSSTISTALRVEVPLLSPLEVREAYNFLEPEAVYEYNATVKWSEESPPPPDSYPGVMLRALKGSEQALRDASMRVSKTHVLEHNIQIATGLLH